MTYTGVEISPHEPGLSELTPFSDEFGRVDQEVGFEGVYSVGPVFRVKRADAGRDLPSLRFLAPKPEPRMTSESTDITISMQSWLVPVARQLQYLLSLPANWDHHGASPIQSKHAQAALSYLNRVMSPSTPPPSIVPVANGGVQIEWHRAGVDVELVFSDENDDELYCYDLRTDREWEGPAVEGFAELELAKRLAEEANYAPA